jgi:hypothetical protein
MLAQIGAFALPALLPDYIARWNLSKTEAGWLVGIFFAAYVVVTRILRKYDYPPDLQEAAVHTVLQQADALSAERANAA